MAKPRAGRKLMKGYEPTSEDLVRGLQIAYSIHRDKALAIRITRKAVVDVESLLRQHSKRDYYAKRRVTYKVNWDSSTLLLLLTLGISRQYEKEQERRFLKTGEGLSESDMHIRYVSFLLSETMSHNSSYVAVGLSQLLYNYSYSEIEAIYDWMAPGDEGFKYPDSFRKIKKKLLDKSMARFRGFLSLAKQLGITRYVPAEKSHWQNSLVEQYLDLFKLGPSPCFAPDAFVDNQAPMEFLSNRTISERNHAEQTRIHILVCPSCFSKLQAALGHDPPRERLELPKFSVPADTEEPVLERWPDIQLPILSYEEFLRVVEGYPATSRTLP